MEIKTINAIDDPSISIVPLDSTACEYTSVKNLNESKYGFWGILARKAKAIFEDDDTTKKFENHGRHQFQAVDTSTGSQEDLTIMENKTADINHETHKLHIRRKGSDQNAQNQATEKSVANAMAAKAKLLLQELETIKADLAFTKERCA
uniref:Uncharacterized protein LOC114912622 n=1 Tax=Elaeis guineensis var. tenera TaxID=51953 RepID=A0A8N4IBS4_ELAGV|nr:uncharacterized protein LOC114912622 [Elaeis guineensis]